MAKLFVVSLFGEFVPELTARTAMLFAVVGNSLIFFTNAASVGKVEEASLKCSIEGDEADDCSACNVAVCCSEGDEGNVFSTCCVAVCCSEGDEGDVLFALQEVIEADFGRTERGAFSLTSSHDGGTHDGRESDVPDAKV